jgi:hypothetical protein
MKRASLRLSRGPADGTFVVDLHAVKRVLALDLGMSEDAIEALAVSR